MKSILLAYVCLAYDGSGGCVDQQVLPAGEWEGPTAAIECDEEAMASRRRLIKEGADRMITVRCESSGGE